MSSAMNSVIETDKRCQHNVIRKTKERYTENVYVCGSCAKLFEVGDYFEPKEPADKPMFDRRSPWGLRSRQA